MRKRITAIAATAGVAALMLLPAAGQADEVDTTCQNGKEAVTTTNVNGKPLVKATVRVLCIQS